MCHETYAALTQPSGYYEPLTREKPPHIANANIWLYDTHFLRISRIFPGWVFLFRSSRCVCIGTMHIVPSLLRTLKQYFSHSDAPDDRRTEYQRVPYIKSIFMLFASHHYMCGAHIIGKIHILKCFVVTGEKERVYIIEFFSTHQQLYKSKLRAITIKCEKRLESDRNQHFFSIRQNWFDFRPKISHKFWWKKKIAFDVNPLL